MLKACTDCRLNCPAHFIHTLCDATAVPAHLSIGRQGDHEVTRKWVCNRHVNSAMARSNVESDGTDLCWIGFRTQVYLLKTISETQ